MIPDYVRMASRITSTENIRRNPLHLVQESRICIEIQQNGFEVHFAIFDKDKQKFILP
jgi:hypothetical protein